MGDVYKRDDDSACNSCGGGGRLPSPLVVLLWLVVAASGTYVMVGTRWLGAGIHLTKPACGWDSTGAGYEAAVEVRNTEPVYKVASVYVRGDFRPAKGKSWLHPSLKNMYETTTQRLTVRLGPREATRQRIQFSIPGDAQQFVCTVTAYVGRQERFKEQPTQDVMQAVEAQL